MKLYTVLSGTPRPRATVNLTITHHFHSAVCTIRARVRSLANRTFDLSDWQIAKLHRELCGVDGCACDPISMHTAYDADGYRWTYYRNA